MGICTVLPPGRAALGVVVLATALGAGTVHAGELEDALRGLAAPAEERVEESINKLATLGDPRAVPALDALTDDRLRADSGGQVYVYDSKKREVCDAITLQPLTPSPGGRPAGLHEVEVSNSIRRVALPVVAQLELGSPDESLRLAAAEELAKASSPDAAVLLHRALDKEKVAKVHTALALAVARVDLQSSNADTRLAAVDLIQRTGNDAFLAELQRIAGRTPEGTFNEPDARVRAAAARAVESVMSQQRLISAAGSLIYGVSLASVLLFAALGLAVTFGLLGVINMAHGEMLMLGAYSTYAVQTVFQKLAPGALQLLSAGGDPGRLRRHLRGRRAARAHGDPAPVRPSAGDAAGDLGHQPDPDPDRAPDLRRAERRRRQSRLARGRRRAGPRVGAAVQPDRRRGVRDPGVQRASGSCCSGPGWACTCAP